MPSESCASARGASVPQSGASIMDLNYLFHRQQVERFRAEDARCPEARNAHAQLACLYEAAIARLTGGKILFVAANKAQSMRMSA